MKLEYILSGPNYARLTPSAIQNCNYDEVADYVSLIKKFNKDVERLCRERYEQEFEISILYNGYSEKPVGVHIKKHGFGFKKTYADSGGLQAATRGADIDKDFKFNIYQSQSHADFAFCFDEIPVTMIKSKDSSFNGRGVISNKLFHPLRLEECAMKTAGNIKEQIEFFDENDKQTKVFIILQGNDDKDIIRWFNEVQKVLDANHWERVAGVAMAGTCSGNGLYEIFNSVKAYRYLIENFDNPEIRKQLHFLGVNGVKRIGQIPYCRTSGLIPEDTIFSMDSTSYTMTYVMGVIKRLPHHKNLVDFLVECFDYAVPKYHKKGMVISREEFAEVVTQNLRSVSKTVNALGSTTKHFFESWIYLVIVWQIMHLAAKIQEIELVADDNNSPQSLIRFCKTHDDLVNYEREYGKYLTSNRINRADSSSIESFFN